MGDAKGQPATPPIRSDARFPYLAQRPPNVPPIEAPCNQEYPPQVIGPPTITYYLPIALDGYNPTGVFFPGDFAFVPGGDVDVISDSNPEGILDPRTPGRWPRGRPAKA